MRRFLLRASGFAFAAALPLACIASAPTGLKRQTDQGSGGGGGLLNTGGSPPMDVPDSGTDDDPHAVLGVDPSHGPFTGGQDVLVRGKGFTSSARVFFGATEVDPGTVQVVDPTRVQVAVPPGAAGSVDVSVEDGKDESTKRTLPGGYTYDALYVTPDSGPVAGGTVVEIAGQGTHWDKTTTAFIDNKPCTALTVVTPTLLDCTVPQGSPGSKPVRVATGKETIVVLDAYSYADSTNGFKGGLSGMPLAGSLKALVYDNFTGDPIPGAYVIVGDDIASAIVKQTDSTGVAVVDDPSLASPETVTIAGACHSPITFVDEPVDTITVYLDPVLTPECAGSGDPPPVGGKGEDTGAMTGDLVWPMTDEFHNGGWSNVPTPIGNEQKTAYVFVTGTDPTQAFQLPDPSQAIHDGTVDGTGYPFATYTFPGDHALYALAGIEDDTANPRRFTAYAMGVARGVPVLPNSQTQDIVISMNKTLDHALTIDATPPAPGPRGPDHLHTTLAIRLGNDGFALLPNGEQDPLLPLSGPLDFVGVPNLDGDLLGATFFATATAATGPTNGTPISAIASLVTNDTSQPLVAAGFPGVPTLTTPAQGAAWDKTHFAATFASGGAAIDMTIYDVGSGGGLAHWVIVVPQASNSITVPDLSGLPMAGLIPGALLVSVTGATIANFDYGSLTYAQMQTSGMSAYSQDIFDAHF